MRLIGERMSFLCDVIFILYLSLTLQITLYNRVNFSDKCGSCFVCMNMQMDVKHYSGRTILRHRACVTTTGLKNGFLLNDKMRNMLRLAKLSMCCWYLILLSGDVQFNPEPVRRVKDPCSICTKECLMKAIMCDLL